MGKIAFVSTLQPQTHYCRYLLDELEKLEDLEIWADKDEKNYHLPYKNLQLCWSKGLFYPWQIFWQAIKSRPKIVHLQHEINMYGGKFSAFLFPLLLLLLKLFSKKIVVTVHAVVPKDEVTADFLQTFNFPQGKIWQWAVLQFFNFLYRSIILFSAAIIVHSQYLKDILVKDYGGKKTKIFVNPIGVPARDNKNYLLKSPWVKKLAGKKIILYFGYILKRKGLEYLISAFEKFYPKHEDYILVLAGGQLDYQKDYAQKLKSQVKKDGFSEKIIFTGFISQQEMIGLYQRCQFVVLPYTYSISSSLPLSFAMQYQKPVIATNIGSLSEEVEDGKDGLLVKVADSKALYMAMEKLAQDHILYDKLSQGQKEKLAERSWQNVAKKTQMIYNKVYKYN
jgi:glycosyltransferase involved in cell wall biosynthesis